MKGIIRRLTAFILCTFILGGLLPAAASVDTSTYEDMTPDVSESHPRLYVSDFSSLKAKYMSDPLTAKWYKALLAQADDLTANVEPGADLGYDIDKLNENCHERIISSRAVLARFYCLAFAAAVENNAAYADRLWEEIEVAASLPHWNPSHWLETAEMTHSFAIAYDWCYGFWNDTQRETIKNAMVSKGLEQAVREYNGSPRWYKWVYGMDGYQTGNNWNIVCNTGVLLGALAIYETDTKLCSTMINNAVRSVRAGLRAYSENGAYKECMSYWRYATNNLVMATSAFENAIGGDFSKLPKLPEPFLYDFSLAPGVSKTPDFLLYAMGNDGIFNYGDTVADAVSTSPALMWLGNRFGISHYTDYHIKTMENNGYEDENLVLNLLWYDGGSSSDTLLPEDKLFEDDFATLRSNWENDGLYASLKGGTNGRPHQHYDIGTFVFDVFGTRFAKSIGAGNYKWDNYFSDRDQFYLARPEGQNTVVINPDEYCGQNTKGSSEFESFYSGDASSYAVLNMTDAYDKVITSDADADDGSGEVYEDTAVTSARRGIKLFRDKSRMIVQDEIKTSELSEIYWFMHTDADISLLNDGKTAALSKNGNKVYLNIVSDKDVVFEKMAASPLESSPAPEEQKESYGTKLAIHAENVTELNLAVEFVPVTLSAPSFTKQYTPLDEWHPERDVAADGRNIKVYGTEKTGTTVTMLTKAPRGALAAVGQTVAGQNGEYTFDFSLPGNYENGIYTVYVNGSIYKTFEMTGGVEASFTVGEPEFSSGDTLSSGKVDFRVNVSNSTTVSGKAACYVALKKDGELIGIKCISSEIQPESSADLCGDIYVPDPCDDCEINVYVWYADYGKDLVPATRRYVYDIHGGS